MARSRRPSRRCGGPAAELAGKWGASQWGRAAGLLHDIGKYSAEFQARVRGAPHQVDHSTAGAQLAVDRYGTSGRLLAHLISGHHGGMPDGACDDAGALVVRLGKRVPRHAAWVDEVVVPAGLDLPRLSGHPTARPTRVGMALSHFGRMVFSALIDADRLDTEAFYAKACGYEIERGDWPSLGVIARQLNTYMAELAGNASDTPVNHVRAEILGQVRCRTGIKRGAASLTVPTGGGKTFASLVWALGHARAWGLDRVIYVIPFTSIIEQTARGFRSALATTFNTSWSSTTPPIGRQVPRTRRSCSRRPRNWDAPIIVTTAVQFYESLFSNSPSRCRKLHNIAKSVVVPDECQTIPADLLMPCVALLGEMVRNYGASILLCTATQPAIIERPNDESRSFLGGLRDVEELMDPKMRLHERLRRVHVSIAPSHMSDGQVAEAMQGQRQSLVIVNTRRHALRLYRALSGVEGASHLSALMCPVHRSKRLAELKKRLKAREAVRLVATTVVEAGVDVDFGAVWRMRSPISASRRSFDLGV